MGHNYSTSVAVQPVLLTFTTGRLNKLPEVIIRSQRITEPFFFIIVTTTQRE